MSIDDAVGFTLQAGLDISLGDGWYLNADVKKTWLDTTVTWRNNAALGGLNVVGDADLDPWIFSGGLVPLQSVRPAHSRASANRLK